MVVVVVVMTVVCTCDYLVWEKGEEEGEGNQVRGRGKRDKGWGKGGRIN